MAMFFEPIVDKSVQCWGCGVFDALFQVVSAAGAALYNYMAMLSVILLAVFIAFYILYSVWKNLYANVDDFTYQKYLRPVLINSLVVLALLSMGVVFPRFVTRITMEPVAEVTLVYAHSMLGNTPEAVAEKVPYEPKPMDESGFYRPELRNLIIQLIQTSTTQFQAMIKMGMYIMDGAISWRALLSPASLIKHIMMFFMGLAVVLGFFRLFIKFCFYFVDVIIALSMFAFFFPLGLVLFIFKDSQSADWVKKPAAAIAPKMLKGVIGSIVTLATVTVTYVVILVLIARFFAGMGSDGTEIAAAAMSGELYSGMITTDNLAAMNLASIIVLIYVIMFLAGRIDEVAKEIIKAFGVDAQTKLDGSVGAAIGDDVVKVGKNIANLGANIGKKAFGVETKKEEKK